jgi:hypothetical protein
MSTGKVELGLRFTAHPATEDQTRKMARLRGECLELALVIDELCPDSREKTDALDHLEYVMYQANASIARREWQP